MQVPGDHWEMEFHSFETVQFGPLRVQNSNSEAFIDHSTIFDPKISQYWRVPSCFNRVLPASRNGIQAPVQKVVDWESWESIVGKMGGNQVAQVLPPSVLWESWELSRLDCDHHARARARRRRPRHHTCCSMMVLPRCSSRRYPFSTHSAAGTAGGTASGMIETGRVDLQLAAAGCRTVPIGAILIYKPSLSCVSTNTLQCCFSAAVCVQVVTGAFGPDENLPAAVGEATAKSGSCGRA